MSNSIIIPAHNEAQTIGRTLGSVLQSSLKDDFTELLVVGSACTDNTLDVATAYLEGQAPAWDYRCLEAPRGQQAALNVGISAARGEVILCVDADVVLDPGALASMQETLQRDSAVKLVGSLVLYNTQELPVKAGPLKALLHAEALRKASLPVRKSVQGGCLGFRSSSGFAFPESATPNDVWISAMVADAYGLDAIDVTMDKRTYYTPPQNWNDYLAMHMRYGAGHTLLRHEYPELFYTVQDVTGYIAARADGPTIEQTWEAACRQNNIDLDIVKAMLRSVDCLVDAKKDETAQALLDANGIWEPVASTKQLVSA